MGTQSCWGFSGFYQEPFYHAAASISPGLRVLSSSPFSDLLARQLAFAPVHPVSKETAPQGGRDLSGLPVGPGPTLNPDCFREWGS